MLRSPLLPRPRVALAMSVAALALPVAGCGDDGGGGGSSDADPAAVVPAAAPVYAEALVRPDGDLEEAVRSVSKKLLKTDDPGGEIVKSLNESIDTDGSYEEDIEPWLGDKVAAAVTGVGAGATEPDYIVVASSKDNDKAQELIDKEKDAVDRTYKSTEYRFDRSDNTAAGIVGDTVVFGTERGFRAAVDAADGEALSERDEFTSSRDDVGDDGLGYVFLDVEGALKLASAAGEEQAQQLAAARDAIVGSGVKTVGMALDVEDDVVRIEAAADGAKGMENAEAAAKAAANAPAGSWLSFGVADVGGTLRQALATIAQSAGIPGGDPQALLRQFEQQAGIDLEEDLLSWMGDATFFVRGSSILDLSGALVVQSKDPAKTKAVLGKVEGLLRAAGQQARPVRGGAVDEGIELAIPGAPGGVTIGIKGETFLIAYGGSQAIEAAAGGGDRLGDSEAWKSAKEALDDADPVFFLDFPQLVSLLDGVVGSDADYQSAKPTLQAFGPLAVGTERDGDTARLKAAVVVK